MGTPMDPDQTYRVTVQDSGKAGQFRVLLSLRRVHSYYYKHYKMLVFAAVAAVASLVAATPFSGSVTAATTADWLVANISTLPTFVQNPDGSYTLSNGRKRAPTVSLQWALYFPLFPLSRSSYFANVVHDPRIRDNRHRLVSPRAVSFARHRF